MISMFRHLFFFIVQFVGATAAVVGACVIYTLYNHGMPYAQTVYFRQDVQLFVKIGMAVAGLFCLVLLCYHLTRRGLEASPDRFDPDKFG